MTNVLTILLTFGILGAPAFARAEEVTTMVGGHEMTYEATPQAPDVQISPKEAVAIASEAKPAKPRVPVDPNAKAPTLK